MAKTRFERKEISALFVEATPERGGLGHWLLASPMLGFVGWLWVDLFRHYSPIVWLWLDLVLGVGTYILLWVLPLGYAAHRVVTALPGLFQNVGWDVQPLEPVEPAEQYTVRYICRRRQRAATDRKRIWLRVAQGWVYLEIAAIFAGALAMVPLFLSVSEFGFGR